MSSRPARIDSPIDAVKSGQASNHHPLGSGCVPDPDTYLLAEYLQAAHREAIDQGVGSGLAWYRVAVRAKELRA